MKVEHATPDKPEILAMAAALGASPDEVFGMCFRMWRWFDQHTQEGNAVGVTISLLNRLLGVTGFAEQALAVGWLEECEVGGKASLRLPNFQRHNGQSSKQRAVTAKRVAQHKQKGNAKGNAPTVTKPLAPALPREEKRREDKNDSYESGQSSDSLVWTEEVTQAVIGDALMIASELPTQASDRLQCARLGYLVAVEKFPSVWLASGVEACKAAKPDNHHAWLLDTLRITAPTWKRTDFDDCFLTARIPFDIIKKIPISDGAAG